MALRTLLRSETSAKHQELDSLVGAIQPFSSTHGYAVYLKSMDALYGRFSEALDQSSAQADLSRNAEPVRDCLANDLDSVNDGAPDFNPSCSPARKLPFEPAACWGIGYTLEGSAMGASFMIRSVHEKLPPDCTTEFLRHLANDSKERWPVFCVALDEAACDQSEALAGANLVFQTAIDIFSEATSAHQVGPNPG